MDVDLSRNLGIQPIYLPETESWEAGFTEFARYVSSYKKEEQNPSIVLSTSAGTEKLPAITELLTLPPDEVRMKLNAASQQFINDDLLFSEFKEKYDLAINHAARVKLGTNNDKWLGYNLISERGSGNFGRVFQASDQNGKHYAIKIAHEAVRDNQIMLSSFRRGVSSMKYLSNSNVRGTVKILDASELPPSIIMEYINGVNLEEAINRDYIDSIAVSIDVIKRISEIVFSCHTHERAILHRDLRPQNIMIGGSFWENIDLDEIRVLDFDLSWFEGATGHDYYMPASSALGYLAPEQLEANSNYSSRSALVDVYGLSMLLYFALSRQHPSAAASEREDWPTRVDEASAKAYSRCWKCLPSRISSAILDGTNPKQNERPLLSSFINRLDELRRLAAGEFLNDPNILREELFQRIFGKFVGKNISEYTNYSGVTVSIGILHEDEVFSFTLASIATESSSRTNMGKYLSDALGRVKDIVKKIAKVEKNDSHVGMSRINLKFTIPFPKSFAELDSYATTLERAISVMRIE
ncbi:protein kinase [Mycoplana sp. MJR14]|uniref:protein kinase domain-containing protein n=1 Tax=Mycoplana sp. MJR14 TaxID=3032583 RepID=UPI0023DBF7DF|nr:protein kinase [Mycoplana sp. MJR14]MDF1633919.1 protein kinase [Mycoplana sp. MJR14]